MVVIGFTNGIAILIASTQIKDFFGLRAGPVPSEFLPRIRLLVAHFASMNESALGLALAPWRLFSSFHVLPGVFPHPSSLCLLAPL
jgi:MFS superfamily sulfate permease-like transporter